MQVLTIVDNAQDVVSALPAVRILSEHRPRVAVFDLPAPVAPAQLLVVPGVRAVVTGVSADGSTVVLGDASALGALSPGEQLFLRGWLTSLGLGGKNRPGDGLSWDAPGFSPPDRKKP